CRHRPPAHDQPRPVRLPASRRIRHDEEHTRAFGLRPRSTPLPWKFGGADTNGTGHRRALRTASRTPPHHTGGPLRFLGPHAGLRPARAERHVVLTLLRKEGGT